MNSQFRHLSLVAFVSLFALFSFACGDDGDGKGNAGGTGGMGGSPEPDTGGTVGRGDAGLEDSGPADDAGPPVCDCPRELSCDDTNTCVEIAPCESDQHCYQGRVCEESACIDGCQSDAQCAASSVENPTCYDGRCGECDADEQCFGDGTCDIERHTCVEPEVCVDSRECLDGRICAGGLCEDAPDCRAEEVNCPPGHLCTEAGTCVIDPSGACETDADCPIIGHVCVEGRTSNRCGPCQEDIDCPMGMRCRVRASGNECTEPDMCANDEECIGSRVCTDDHCTVPDCTDDAYEENNDAASATPIIAGLLRDLTSCGSDADWFEFSLPANHAGTVSVRQQDNQANLSLRILNGDQVQLGSSATDQPVEALVVGPFPTQQPIYVVVNQDADFGVGTYVLEIELLDQGEACIDDAQENGAGDDQPESGRQIRAPGELGFGGNLAGRICPDDLDYLCFATQPREQVTIAIEVTAGDAVIEGRVLRGNGEAVRNTEGQWSRQGGEAVGFRAGAGPYCLEIGASSGTGSYRVNISAVPSDLIELCENASPLELQDGNASAQAQLSLENTFSPICAGDRADSGESIYTVTFNDGAQLPTMLVAHVEGIVGGTLGDPVVSVRSACGDASTELACSTGQRDPADPLFMQRTPATVRVPITELGTYSVMVDAINAGERPNYRVEVETAPLAVAPENDTCVTAAELAFNPDGVTVFGVNLDQATDAVGGCVGEGGPDAVYRVTFLERANVRLQASAANDAFAVTAFLGADCRSQNAQSCGFGFETQVEPGDYYLVIDGTDTNARGRVTIQMVVDSLTGMPANETCEEAMRLASEGGSLAASTAAASDDYQLLEANLCTGHNTLGGDLVYAINNAEPGMMYVQAIPADGWDLALYVVSECESPARRRIACSDGALDESVVFDAAADETVYVIVDGSNGETGDFELRWGSAECRLDVDCAAGSCIDFNCHVVLP
jgi:hypothetical protein